MDIKWYPVKDYRLVLSLLQFARKSEEGGGTLDWALLLNDIGNLLNLKDVF